MIKGLHGVFKLVDGMLIGGKERHKALLKRCREAGMTLTSNKVQVGSTVTFAGYIIDGTKKLNY